MRIPVINKIWLLPILILLPISIVALRSRPATLIVGETSTAKPPAAALATLPPVILWAWERPEKLDFIDPKNVGVAFLAKTLSLKGDRVATRPRLQPLDLAAGTKLVAVVRIESDRRLTPTLSTAQLDRAATQVVELAELPRITAIQIDFDATLSERDFYRALLSQIRRDLPASLPLSITALASWCAGDDWLSGLPVDEAVPMLFRMGVDRRQFEARLKAKQQFEAPLCRHAAGVSTDELIAAPDVHRLYLFNPASWTERSLDSAMEAYKK